MSPEKLLLILDACFLLAVLSLVLVRRRNIRNGEGAFLAANSKPHVPIDWGSRALLDERGNGYDPLIWGSKKVIESDGTERLPLIDFSKNHIVDEHGVRYYFKD